MLFIVNWNNQEYVYSCGYLRVVRSSRAYTNNIAVSFSTIKYYYSELSSVG